MRFATYTLAALAFCGANAADAALIHNYELNGSLADSLGGPSLTETTPGSGVIGAQAYTFAQNQGLRLAASALPSLSTYSVETSFLFTDTTGYRRILDFKNRASDTGLYNLNTALNFYNIVTGTSGTIVPAVQTQVVFTRDGTTGTVAGYVNGVQQITFNDAGGLSVIDTFLTFFQDDLAVSNEASAGRADFIRIYDNALTATEVAALPTGTLPMTPPVTGQVPEPASWAMMIGGFGMIGAALRRRRTMFAFAG